MRYTYLSPPLTGSLLFHKLQREYVLSSCTLIPPLAGEELSDGETQRSVWAGELALATLLESKVMLGGRTLFAQRDAANSCTTSACALQYCVTTL